ncbi:hypothetical protein chiPu_0020562 [Chiloscyllium punctatum]|uniref:Uncharacterized protein n=1 Tax=Chiloscyllium punctatum TaxID=137246 RepID=A0A401RH04_CHIPU|nr:hypothetical protein [Chiloscyllium punctatum]
MGVQWRTRGWRCSGSPRRPAALQREDLSHWFGAAVALLCGGGAATGGPVGLKFAGVWSCSGTPLRLAALRRKTSIVALALQLRSRVAGGAAAGGPVGLAAAAAGGAAVALLGREARRGVATGLLCGAAAGGRVGGAVRSCCHVTVGGERGLVLSG